MNYSVVDPTVTRPLRCSQCVCLCSISLWAQPYNLNHPNKGNSSRGWIIFFSFTEISNSSVIFFKTSSHVYDSAGLMRLYQGRSQGQWSSCESRLTETLSAFIFCLNSITPKRLQTPLGQQLYFLSTQGCVWDMAAGTPGWTAEVWCWHVCVCVQHALHLTW